MTFHWKQCWTVTCSLCTMAQAVKIPASHHRGPGSCRGQSKSFSFLVNIAPLWLSTLIYHLRYEQYAHWWTQFRVTISPNWHEHEHVLLYSGWNLSSSLVNDWWDEILWYERQWIFNSLFIDITKIVPTCICTVTV